MRHISIRGVLFLACALCILSATLNLQPDATAGLDTELLQHHADWDYSTVEYFIVEYTGVGEDTHGIIKFDVSSISGSTVNSATMSLWIAQAQTDRNILAYPILSGNTGVTEAASWNHKNGTDDWAGGHTGCNTSGTDRSATSCGTFDMGSKSVNEEVQSSITSSVVQGWVDGSNYGLVLIDTNHTGATKWHSSDVSTSGYRPKLSVDYTEAGGSRKRIVIVAGHKRKYAQTPIIAFLPSLFR